MKKKIFLLASILALLAFLWSDPLKQGSFSDKYPQIIQSNPDQDQIAGLGQSISNNLSDLVYLAKSYLHENFPKKTNPPKSPKIEDLPRQEDPLLSQFLAGLEAFQTEKTITIRGQMDYDPQEFLAEIEEATDGTYISAIFRNLNVKYETVSLFNTATLRTQVTLQANYHHSLEQEQELTRWVDQKIAEWGLEDLSDFKKIESIHDKIIQSTSYLASVDLQQASTDPAPTSFRGISVHSPYSILANGKGVCQAYAALFQKFCDRLGLPSRYIIGQATSQGQVSDHAWNKVQLDGRWYNIDLTWDDPVVNLNGQLIDRPKSGYENKKYFLKSDAFFMQDHQAKNGLDLIADKNF